ncbi:MAG: dihydroorotate dehydrogenase electron transfer subunit [Candidatus Lokiarchaeota archaeon]|nr:dihydroorotate dehydrogenase electron transfer subunit [Candidatus Lokiarchaeota archaeon]
MDLKQEVGNPTSIRITRIVEENRSCHTLYFDIPWRDCSIQPGQFIMVWIRDVDEIPLGICYCDDKEMGMTVRRVGEATDALQALQPGDYVGLRGPFGNGFTLNCKNPLLIGGGIGMAPLRYLTKTLLHKGSDVTLLVAAKTESELLLYDYDNRASNSFRLEIATDDGSRGFEGLATELADSLLKKHDFDRIYACGPELMMASLLNLASDYGLPLEASLERYMKCGCGICGTCAMDPQGLMVCVDGPVLSGKKLRQIDEFGSYTRDSTGQRRPL